MALAYLSAASPTYEETRVAQVMGLSVSALRGIRASGGESNVAIADFFGISAAALSKIQAATPTNVAVAPATASIGTVTNKTVQLTATVTPASSADKRVIWTSGTPAAATVNADGLVTAVAAGTSIITATSVVASGIKGTSTITVTATRAATGSAEQKAEPEQKVEKKGDPEEKDHKGLLDRITHKTEDKHRSKKK